jgi:hypothetical protein
MTVDVNAGLAAFTTLYDSAGNPIVNPGVSVPLTTVPNNTPTSPQVYSYSATAFVSPTGQTISAIFQNNGVKAARVRSIWVAMNNVSGASAAQTGYQVTRYQVASFEVGTAVSAFLTLGSSIASATNRAFGAPPSQCSMYYLAGGMATSTRFNEQILAQVVIPLRTPSYCSFLLDFDDPEPYSPLVLQPREGLRFQGTNASPPTNVTTVQIVWDEDR